jgi:methylthioribose-1-phosphate isomerase
MMRDLIANSIRYENGSFHILDQTKLPNVEEWIKCSTVDEFGHGSKQVYTCKLI